MSLHPAPLFQQESVKLTPPAGRGCDGDGWVQSSSEPRSLLRVVCCLQTWFLKPAPRIKNFSFQNKTKRSYL